MSPDPLSSDFDPLDEPAEEFLARYRRGERPALAEYEARFPALAGRIRTLFPALVELERAGHVPADAAAVVPGLPAAARDGVPPRIGEFRILRTVGEGGMGVVYEAVQESLGRHVALKVLPPNRKGTYLERFRREARVAARLHHTNIVPVYGVGEADGLHFYAMQFIPGQGLDTVLNEVRRLRGPRSPATERVVGPTPTIARSVAEGLLSGTFPPATDPPPAVPAPAPVQIHAAGSRNWRASRWPVLPGGGPDRDAGGRGAGLRPRPGHLAPRHQALEPAPRPDRHRLGDRLRAARRTTTAT